MGKTIIAIIIFGFTVTSSFAAVVEGVNMPEKVSVGSEELVLNGAGVRVKKIAFFPKDIYVAGLYLKAKSSDAGKIINADETMALRIKIITSLITSKLFTEHTRDGFKESTNGNTAPIQKEIDQFLNVFSEKIHKGDLFEIIYRKGIGVQVFKNGADHPAVTIAGMPLKSALFGVWLGDRSEENLRILAAHLLDNDRMNNRGARMVNQ